MPGFAKELSIAVADVEIKADRQYRASVVQIFNSISFQTPFDKGGAKASWLAGKSNDGAIGTVRINFTDAHINPIGMQTVMYSNLPYMKRLSEGWSAQRPNGWIQAIVATWPAVVKRNEVLA